MITKPDHAKKCTGADYSREARRFYIVLSISVAAIIIAESALVKLDFATWIKVVIALAHVPFTALVAIYGWRVLMAMDELQRGLYT